MSELQIGLIALGVLLILLVLGFNWWQDRRVRRRMQEHFPACEQDPLLGAGAVETRVARREPGMGQGAEGAASQAAPAPDKDDDEEPDPAVEVVIEVHFAEPVRGAELLSSLQPLQRIGQKPVRVFATTDRGRHRSRINAEETYSTLQLAVLLANRSGALSAIEWSQAWASAQELADRFEGSLEGPDQQAVLEQAASLDGVCAALDAQVGLTLLLAGARPTTEVLDIALAQGFVRDGAKLAWMADGGIVRFTLARADGVAFEAGGGRIDRLYLLLDVPCTETNPQAFGRMVDVGRELAQRLNAELVDDQGRALAPGAEQGIDEQLQALFARLEQAGLSAGGERARRVFS